VNSQTITRHIGRNKRLLAAWSHFCYKDVALLIRLQNTAQGSSHLNHSIALASHTGVALLLASNIDAPLFKEKRRGGAHSMTEEHHKDKRRSEGAYPIILRETHPLCLDESTLL
jgi:hypothetical protein